jgi:hypothetical protein
MMMLDDPEDYVQSMARPLAIIFYLCLQIKYRAMERIVIQVDDRSGKIYNQLSGDKQQQISEAVNLLLKKAANDATAIGYRNMLDEFGNKAIANGLLISAHL